MATSTTNFGLTKPAYNEAADVAVINGNMDTVDTVMGVNRNLAKGAQAGLAIVADGDTHAAITAGQYVYVRNNTHSLAEGLYVASANVSANGNITGSNMTAVSGGGLNALNSKITNVKTATNMGQYTSLDTFKSDLIAIAQSLNSFESKLIQFVFTSTVNPFTAWSTFAGWIHCIQYGSTSLYFACNISSNNAEHVVIGYSNGTWTIKKTTNT